MKKKTLIISKLKFFKNNLLITKEDFMRPQKNTVDYFPHYCNHHKTMFTIEQKFGNDGYSFWFKLLELLGNTENHVINCRNPGEWEFLQAKTRLDENTCRDILNLLSKLDAIDKELWEADIIWCEILYKIYPTHTKIAEEELRKNHA